MGRLIIERVASAIPTLFIIILLAFFLLRLAPGGPFDNERALDPAIAADLRKIYRLDLPLWQQFWYYFSSLLRGDFGPSFHWRDFSVWMRYPEPFRDTAFIGHNYPAGLSHKTYETADFRTRSVRDGPRLS